MPNEREGLLRATLTFVLLAGGVAALRIGTFDALPTWDSAMGVWPAAIEISADWDFARVLASETYVDGGPNTHTLSLFTLAAAALISVFGPAAAYFLMHCAGVVMAAALGLLTWKVLRQLGLTRLATLGGLGTALFPMVVSQSAYLYTELPSSLLAFLALHLAYRRRVVLSTAALLCAVLVKSLAVVALPALGLMIWLRTHSLRSMLISGAALLGVVPALMASHPPLNLDIPSQLRRLIFGSLWFLERSPEVMVILVLPLVAAIVFIRKEASVVEWIWLWVASGLGLTFTAFFALNWLFNAGVFFLPRYATLLVPTGMILAFLIISKIFDSAASPISVAMIVVLLLGARGPLAWGSGDPAHPLAERSMAYLEQIVEEKAGLERLAELDRRMPVFYDHLAHYAYTYPDLLYVDQPLVNGTAVFLHDDWGDLDALPDSFAMLVAYPSLGGEDMRRVQEDAMRDPRFVVSVEAIGTARVYPLQIVVVERLDD